MDSSVLGLWELIPDAGEEKEKKERMMVLKYSGTEYMIHYPIGEDAMYFRAYPVKIGGVQCVQLQAIGTHKGSPDKEEKNLYHVASYQLNGANLEIKLLNAELVDDELKTSAALTRSFKKHKGHKNLFINPGTFRRVEK
ncbi:MAG: hypothetical protein H8E20_09460 [Verrucomicrobia bacterium]|nr:hypothetical protein [Verrucomicrobiota bacterium]